MMRAEKNKLKKLLHQAVIVRYGNKCLRCGKNNISASHIYPKGVYHDMEWDIDNVIPLCYRCHIHFWHKNPVEAHQWLEFALPKEQLKSLEAKAVASHNTFKIKKIYKYEEVKNYLEGIINEKRTKRTTKKIDKNTEKCL